MLCAARIKNTVTGTWPCRYKETTAKVAKDFKVFYQKVPGSAPGIYTVDHSAGSFVYDPQGRLRLFVRHAAGAQPIAHDIRKLLDG